MIIGVPKEIKQYEYRVALTPAGVERLKIEGHQIFIQQNAGEGSGYQDDIYKQVGAEIIDSAEEIFDRAEMIMKVKEPLELEYGLIKENQIIFTYFHFAASEVLTNAMLESKCVAIAYETVQKQDGSLPLLVPMSEVAGRMAIQEGAKYLEKEKGGRGILLGGVPGVEPAEVLIIGGGIVGTNAAKMASGLGANVVILDIDLNRLRYLDDIMPKNVVTLMSNSFNIRHKLPSTDLLVGAVLIPGAKAPNLVTHDMLKLMKPGSVIVDVAVDQGGCIETCKPTFHDNPTYVVEDIIHYCVANMPGAVPFTSTIALTNATIPYALKIANLGFEKAILTDKEIESGVNMIGGKLTYQEVANAFNFNYTPLSEVLSS